MKDKYLIFAIVCAVCAVCFVSKEFIMYTIVLTLLSIRFLLKYETEK